MKTIENHAVQAAICKTKVRYPTESKANFVLYRMKDDKDLKVYHCPVCTKWHIGHKHRRK